MYLQFINYTKKLGYKNFLYTVENYLTFKYIFASELLDLSA